MWCVGGWDSGDGDGDDGDYMEADGKIVHDSDCVLFVLVFRYVVIVTVVEMVIVTVVIVIVTVVM